MAEINALICLMAIQPEVPVRIMKMLTRCLKMSAQIGHMNLEGIKIFFNYYSLNSNYIYSISILKYLLITSLGKENPIHIWQTRVYSRVAARGASKSGVDEVKMKSILDPLKHILDGLELSWPYEELM